MFKIFESNLTKTDVAHPCREQFTPVGTKYTEYLLTTEYNWPRSDLYGPGSTILIEPPKAEAGPSIVEIAIQNPELSTLVKALAAADLIGTLSGNGPFTAGFTLFAPTNAAFAALPAGVLDNLLKPENKARLVDVLTYHVVAGDVQAKDLVEQFGAFTYGRGYFTTVEGKALLASTSDQKSIRINDARIINVDVLPSNLVASNGVVHLIDSVLLPSTAPIPPSPVGSILELAIANPGLSTLVKLVKGAGLVGDLSGKGPFTVFAPSNAAFDRLVVPGGNVVDYFLKPENKAKLLKTLNYHIVSGPAIFKNSIETESAWYFKSVEGTTLTLYNVCGKNGTDCSTSQLKVDDYHIFHLPKSYVSTVIKADNVASNGVVQILDTVLDYSIQ